MSKEPSPQEARQILRDFTDHATYCREALTFHNQQGVWGPLVLSPGGVKVCKAARDQQLRGQPVRVLVLKPRRAYISTTIASWIVKVLMHKPEKAMVLAHLQDTADEMYKYYLDLSERAQFFRGIGCATVVRKLDGKLIEYSNGSIVEFGTANTLEGGRGKGPRHLHLTEYAFYTHAGQLMRNLMQGVPEDADTSVWVDTTANGMGGQFYQDWVRNETGNKWAKVFFGWHEHPVYATPLQVAAADFQASLNAEEKDMMSRYRLTFEQLAWRRDCIINKCLGNKDTFYQEYPSNAEEAFLHSGRAVFDAISLNRMPVQAEAWTMGTLQELTVGTRKALQFVVRPDGNAPLAVIRRPQVGRRYVLGIDTSQGIDAGGKSGKSDPDFSVIQVVDEETGEQVAVFRDRVGASVLARWSVDIARWYNDAFLVPESTGYGAATVENLLLLDYPRDRIFWRGNHQPFDRAGMPSRVEEFGFQTGAQSKPLLVEGLNLAIIEGSITVQHSATMAELRAYCADAMGRTNAPSGDHDDLVMSLALAVVGKRAFSLQCPRKSATGNEFQTVRYKTA